MPPSNDNQAGAIDLGNGATGSVDGDTTGGTTQNISNDVWYKWTPPAGNSGRIVLQVAYAPVGGAAGVPAFCGVYHGTFPSITYSGYGYYFYTNTDPWTVPIYSDMNPGTDYFFNVGQGEGPFRLTWTWIENPPPPANDDYADATPLTGMSGSQAFDIAFATREDPQEQAFSDAWGGNPPEGWNSIWFRFVAPVDGRVTVESKPDGDFSVIPDGAPPLTLFKAGPLDTIDDAVLLCLDDQGEFYEDVDNYGSKVMYPVKPGDVIYARPSGDFGDGDYFGPCHLNWLFEAKPSAPRTISLPSPLPGSNDPRMWDFAVAGPLVHALDVAQYHVHQFGFQYHDLVTLLTSVGDETKPFLQILDSSDVVLREFCIRLHATGLFGGSFNRYVVYERVSGTYMISGGTYLGPGALNVSGYPAAGNYNFGFGEGVGIGWDGSSSIFVGQGGGLYTDQSNPSFGYSFGFFSEPTAAKVKVGILGSTGSTIAVAMREYLRLASDLSQLEYTDFAPPFAHTADSSPLPASLGQGGAGAASVTLAASSFRGLDWPPAANAAGSWVAGDDDDVNDAMSVQISSQGLQFEVDAPALDGFGFQEWFFAHPGVLAGDSSDLQIAWAPDQAQIVVGVVMNDMQGSLTGSDFQVWAFYTFTTVIVESYGGMPWASVRIPMWQNQWPLDFRMSSNWPYLFRFSYDGSDETFKEIFATGPPWFFPDDYYGWWKVEVSEDLGVTWTNISDQHAVHASRIPSQFVQTGVYQYSGDVAEGSQPWDVTFLGFGPAGGAHIATSF